MTKHILPVEPDGATNVSAVLERWYTDGFADHGTNMITYQDIGPLLNATFSSDWKTVTLSNTDAFDAMASALHARGVTQLAFPYRVFGGHANIHQHGHYICANETWELANRDGPGTPATFDVFAKGTNGITDLPHFAEPFRTAFTALVRAVAAHLRERGWLPPRNATKSAGLDASVLYFCDEPAFADPFTANAILAIQNLIRSTEPDIKLAQTRFPTNQSDMGPGPINETPV